MRIILYSFSISVLVFTSAFSEETSSFRPRFKTISNYNIKSLSANYSDVQNYQTTGIYQISANNEVKKFSHQIKKNTSSEGSVELIEMIKSAKSKKEAGKQKK